MKTKIVSDLCLICLTCTLYGCCAVVPVSGQIESVGAGTALTWVINALDPSKPGGEIFMAVIRSKVYVVVSVPWEGGRGVVGAIDAGIKNPESLQAIRGNFMNGETYQALRSGLLQGGWQEVRRGSTPVLLTIAAQAASTMVRTLPTPVLLIAPGVLGEIKVGDGVYRLDKWEATNE